MSHAERIAISSLRVTKRLLLQQPRAEVGATNQPEPVQRTAVGTVMLSRKEMRASATATLDMEGTI